MSRSPKNKNEKPRKKRGQDAAVFEASSRKTVHASSLHHDAIPASGATKFSKSVIQGLAHPLKRSASDRRNTVARVQTSYDTSISLGAATLAHAEGNFAAPWMVLVCNQLHSLQYYSIINCVMRCIHYGLHMCDLYATVFRILSYIM